MPGDPVPCIQGPHPTPGCHPLVGTPEDLGSLMSEPNLAEGKSIVLESSSNIPLPDIHEKSHTPPRLSHGRASVFPVANMKVKPIACTLKKPSISSPDIAVNASHVAYGNPVPKSLPGKLGTIGKEALQRRDAAVVVASIAQQAASAMETLVKIMKKFAELCSEADPKAPDTAIEQFLDLHCQTSQTLTAMEELINTATSNKMQAFEDTEKMPNSFEDKENSSNTVRWFLHEIGCNSNPQEPPLNSSKALLRKSSQDLSGSSKAGLLSRSSASCQAQVTYKKFSPRISLSRGAENHPIPKKNPHPNYTSSLQSPIRFSNQDIEKKGSNPADQQPPHAQDSRRKNGFYQMARLAKKVKNEIESWFIDFIEKTLDTCFKNINSCEDSSAMTEDSNRILPSASRKWMSLTQLIDWVESQCSGGNREGLSSYSRMRQVLSRLKLKATKY